MLALRADWRRSQRSSQREEPNEVSSCRRVEKGSWCTYVALAADGLLAVVLGGESLQGGLDDTTTQAQDEVKGGLLQVESHVSRIVLDV